MSIAAAALGLTREFEFDGQTYTLRPLAYEDMARFGLWVEDRARIGMGRTADSLDMDARTAAAALADNIAAGNYEPGGPVFARAAATEAGRRKILELMLDTPDRGTVSWAVFADPEAFDRVLGIAREINADPQAVAARRRPAVRSAAPSP